MADTKSQSTRDGDGTLLSFNFTFEYLQESDVNVSLTVNATQATTELTRSTDWTFANATTIAFNSIATETDWQETSGAPKDGVTVRIYRVTDTDSAQATFFAGSAIRAQDLNNNNTQLLYAIQETVNRRLDSTGGTMSGDLNMGGNKITNGAAGTDANDFMTYAQLVTAFSNLQEDGYTINSPTANVAFTGTTQLEGLTVSDSATFSDDVTINSTGFLKIPVGTDAQQPGQDDQPAAATGQIRFNTDITQFEGCYNGSEWSSIGGGATGGGGDTVFVETSQLITTDYTLTTGNTIAEKKNAMSVGPVTIGPSATVTVPFGQSWVIV
jgi:hypothetical protein